MSIEVKDVLHDSLDKLYAQLEKDRKAKVDFRAPPKAMTMLDDGNTFTTGVKALQDQFKAHGMPAEFKGRPLFHRHLGQLLGIPAPYYDRMRDRHGRLLAENVNTWMASLGQREDIKLFRTIYGEARSIHSSSYKVIDNEHLAFSLRPALAKIKSLQVADCAITERRLYIKLYINDLSKTMKLPGGGKDTVRAGLMLSTSEVGEGAASITPMLRRDACGNNLLAYFGKFKAFHVGRRHELDDEVADFLSEKTKALDIEATLAVLKDSITGVLSKDTFERNCEMIDSAAKDSIMEDNLDQLVSVVSKNYRLTEDEAASVTDKLGKGGIMSRWGLVNAITQTGRDLRKEKFDRATELEDVGGRLLAAEDWRQAMKTDRTRREKIAA